MVIIIFISSLTTALIINTWLDDAGLFRALTRRLLLYARQHKWPSITGTLAYISICRYCLSHWMGAVVSFIIAPDWRTSIIIIAPTIFLANIIISLYSLTSEYITYLRWRNFLSRAEAEARGIIRKDTAA